MTREEFSAVLKRHYMPSFPDTAKYIRSQSEETRRVWATRFAHQEPRDLVAACVMICNGDIDPIPAYEREQFAVWILRACKTARIERNRREMIRDNRRDAHKREQLRRDRTKPDVNRKGYADNASIGDGLAERMDAYGCGPAFREILRAVDVATAAGKPRDEVEAIRVAVTRDVAERVRSGADIPAETCQNYETSFSEWNE